MRILHLKPTAATDGMTLDAPKKIKEKKKRGGMQECPTRTKSCLGILTKMKKRINCMTRIAQRPPRVVGYLLHA